MNSEWIIKEFGRVGIIPVIVCEDPDQAEPLADALADGGLPAAEVTFRRAGADEVIARMRKRRPELLVGAGTVVDMDDLVKAKEAGAAFAVSPGINREICAAAISMDLPFCPGVVTASELDLARGMGFRAVKFFPAEPAGGLRMIRALAGPFPMMRFMPTGGVSIKNADAYLSDPLIFCVGGSWIAPAALMAEGNYEQIRKNAEEAAGMVRSLRR
ncbi:MAG: bifunctional 4-hydroxy-2-oxoglutarate aldolase/2-dehydro-3-deoxy-phosphogluconate aldolase [Lachnospiraceae bacterium]|nr:bifunctional 4-hydroxy-2-oxoglutarate aldolase/2-dehydro-3-deoxy-phosphogluconate aldolase [Lachnospiraceae bacterium]